MKRLFQYIMIITTKREFLLKLLNKSQNSAIYDRTKATCFTSVYNRY